MEIPNYSKIKISDISLVKGYKETFKKYGIITLEQALWDDILNNLSNKEEVNERRKKELITPITLLRAKYLGESLPNLWHLGETYEEIYEQPLGSYENYIEVLKSLGIQYINDHDCVAWHFRYSKKDRLIDVWKKIYEAIKNREIYISNKSSHNKQLINVSNAEVIKLYVEEYYRKNGIIKSLKEELKSLEETKEDLLKKLSEVEGQIFDIAIKMKKYIELEATQEFCEPKISPDFNKDINKESTLVRKK